VSEAKGGVAANGGVAWWRENTMVKIWANDVVVKRNIGDSACLSSFSLKAIIIATLTRRTGWAISVSVCQ